MAFRSIAAEFAAALRVSDRTVQRRMAAAEALTAQGISRVGLLGTKYTMTQAFYRDKLVERGIEVLIPEGYDIDLVNRVIFEELCLGIVKEDSRAEYLRVIAAFISATRSRYFWKLRFSAPWRSGEPLL